jgi:hypothetical protein
MKEPRDSNWTLTVLLCLPEAREGKDVSDKQIAMAGNLVDAIERDRRYRNLRDRDIECSQPKASI